MHQTSRENKYLRLSANFEGNTTVSVLGVIDRLGTSLYVGADAVVVAGGESFKVVQAMDGDSVFGGIVTNCSSVTGDIALRDVVGRLGTNQEAVTTKDGIGGESGSLRTQNYSYRIGFSTMYTLNKSSEARVWKPDCL
jgi:hypothetical protein